MLCSGRVPPGLFSSCFISNITRCDLWPLPSWPVLLLHIWLEHQGRGAAINKGVLPAVTASPPCTLGLFSYSAASRPWGKLSSLPVFIFLWDSTESCSHPVISSSKSSAVRLETKKVIHLRGIVSPPLRIRLFLVLPLCFCVSWS